MWTPVCEKGIGIGKVYLSLFAATLLFVMIQQE